MTYIWTERVPSKTYPKRYKGYKLQQVQTDILKTVGVISKASDFLIKLNAKSLNNINFVESLSSIVHYTNSIVMPRLVNSRVEQNGSVNIVSILVMQYHC